MTENSSSKPQVWFWIVSVVALIWNLMGVIAYLGQAYMSDDVLNALPEAEQALYNDIPAWATAAFAIAVWGGALACIFLLLRKKLATLIFMLSFLGIVIQMIYNLFISKASEVYGPVGFIMPITVFIIGAFLIWFSKKSESKGWIS